MFPLASMFARLAATPAPSEKKEIDFPQVEAEIIAKMAAEVGERLRAGEAVEVGKLVEIYKLLEVKFRKTGTLSDAEVEVIRLIRARFDYVEESMRRERAMKDPVQAEVIRKAEEKRLRRAQRNMRTLRPSLTGRLQSSEPDLQNFETKESS